MPLYTLQRRRQSITRNGAICGYVFDDIDQEDPCEDGSFHHVHLDQTLNLNKLQEGCVVSTIAARAGSSQILLGVRSTPEISDQEYKQKEDETKKDNMICS